MQARSLCVSQRAGRAVRSLVSTIPLPLTYELLADAPDNLRRRRKGSCYLDSQLQYRHRSPGISDKHWIYFPETNTFLQSRISSEFLRRRCASQHEFYLY